VSPGILDNGRERLLAEIPLGDRSLAGIGQTLQFCDDHLCSCCSV